MTTNNEFEFNQFPVHRPEKLAKLDPRESRITIAAGAMIFSKNKLLLNRSDSSDLWSIPGGIITFTESSEQAVIREIKEELNLEVTIVDPLPYVFSFDIESENAVDKIVLLHFLAKVKPDGKIVMGDGVADYKWESIASAFRDCYPNVKPAVDHFMNI